MFRSLVQSVSSVRKVVNQISILYVRFVFPPVDGDLDEVASIVSIETNSRQRERRAELEGVVCGVLREEEAQRLKEGPIKLRPYQDELLESARRGNNVLIWLPTGTGKTYIVLKYAEVGAVCIGGRWVCVCMSVRGREDGRRIGRRISTGGE